MVFEIPIYLQYSITGLTEDKYNELRSYLKKHGQLKEGRFIIMSDYFDDKDVSNVPLHDSVDFTIDLSKMMDIEEGIKVVTGLVKLLSSFGISEKR